MYLCVTLIPVPVSPSPKSQSQETTVAPLPPPPELSVKSILVGKQPVVLLTLKSATGAGNTVMVTGVATLDPLALLIVNVIV